MGLSLKLFAWTSAAIPTNVQAKVSHPANPKLSPSFEAHRIAQR